MSKRHLAAASGMIAVGVMLVGCVANVPVSSPSPAPSLATSTPTPTPTQDAGQAAAGAVVERYVRALDQLAADPSADLNTLYEVAGGEVVRAQLQALQQLHVAKYKYAGEARVELQDVEGTGSPYTVIACIDTSEVSVADQDGRSVTSPDEAQRRLWRHKVEEVQSRLVVVKEEVIAESC